MRSPLLRAAMRTLLLCVVLGHGSRDACAQPSLRTKIGQMVMVTVTGDSVNDSSPSMNVFRSDCSQGLIGGLVLFNWSNNLKSLTRIRRFVEDAQALPTVPLFLAIDQEGGRVARLNGSNGFSATPSAFRLGTTLNREDSTRQAAATMAFWFNLTGLNMNLAPVVDVNVNPASPAIGAVERSYSADPATVAAHAGWFIDEFRSRGVITVLKHFPGHGSATGDSHLGFTDITLTWGENELIPYATLLSRGNVDGVMVGHLYNATIDSLYPATLSSAAIGGLLRGRLGYDGVVVSDAMGMRALTDLYSFEEAVVRAVGAGVDILLYTKNQDSLGGSLAKQIVDLIEARVGDGTISPSRIDESYGRIMHLKERILTAIAAAKETGRPERFSVSNYPNPFNPSTVIRLEGPAGGSVDLTLFDVLGRVVTEFRDIRLAEGRAEGRWEAPSGRASGIYFCRAVFRATGSGATSTKTIRMILLR